VRSGVGSTHHAQKTASSTTCKRQRSVASHAGGDSFVQDVVRAQRVLDTLSAGDGEKVGVSIVRRAIEEPLRTIAANAGREGSVVVDMVRSGETGFGYNAARDEYEDLVAAGVIDPTKVVRCALQNAASVAGLILTTECLIAEQPKAAAGAPSMDV
jgi:chaperonin GroEL